MSYAKIWCRNNIIFSKFIVHMSYYKLNKDIIIKKNLIYYNLHKHDEEWQIKRQNYQHYYYFKNREKRLEDITKRRKLKKLMNETTKPKVDNETKIKKKKNLKRVQRHVKSYKNVSTVDTLDVEFD